MARIFRSNKKEYKKSNCFFEGEITLIKKQMQKLYDFIRSERNRFETKQNNMFAFSFSEISRYHDYLRIIHARYKTVSKKFAENSKALQESFKMGGSGAINDEQNKMLQESIEIGIRLHLEIEAFYLFAKILLDKISLSIQFYFGVARSLSLASHGKLTRNIDKYIKTKGLTINPELVEHIKKLKEDISDFRDYQIQHIPDYRQGRIIRGTGFDREGNARISLMALYPTERDKQYNSKLLPEMLSDIEEYIVQVIDFIENNKNKTALPLESNPIRKVVIS